MHTQIVTHETLAHQLKQLKPGLNYPVRNSKYSLVLRPFHARQRIQAQDDSKEGDARKPPPELGLAPSKPKTAYGQMLQYYLKKEPQLFKAAVEDRLAALKAQKDAFEARKQQEGRLAPGSEKHELSLYRRMDELRMEDVRVSVEDLMYVSILEKFVSCGVEMLPRMDGVVDPAPTNLTALTEGIHSREALELVREHLMTVMGVPGVAQHSTVKVKMSKFQMVQVYAASIMFGYFLRRVDRRFQLERSLGLLPMSREEAVARLEALFNMADAEEIDPDRGPGSTSSYPPTSAAPSTPASTSTSTPSHTSAPASTPAAPSAQPPSSSSQQQHDQQQQQQQQQQHDQEQQRPGSPPPQAPAPSSTSAAASSSSGPAHGDRPSPHLPVRKEKSALRRYVESFDQAALVDTARIVSAEGAALVERQASAVLGDVKRLTAQIQDIVAQDAHSPEEVVARIAHAVETDAIDTLTLSLATQRRAVLEAVAYGTFLRDIETWVDGEYGLLTPLPAPRMPPGRGPW